MKSNYKKISEHIREVNVRNTELKANTLLGINIDKYYMPSVANIVGTDMSVYKIVKPGQFACNRMHVGRDYRLPVALSRSHFDFIVSPAYDVFEIIDNKILLPEYLMMWFSRKEFDRNAWFYTDADVRGGLPWKSFCEMDIPVPHHDKQKEILKEYNTIINQIALNNQLIQKLEEMAQTIYKQWFVDFEFPDENGKPYGCNGGEMEFNEEFQIQIPKDWSFMEIKYFGKVITGKTPSSEKPEHFGNSMPFVTPGDFSQYGKFAINAERKLSVKGITYFKNKILSIGSVIVTCIGSDMGKVAIASEDCITNQQMNSILPNVSYYSDYLYYNLKSISHELKSKAMGGSTMPMLSKSEFEIVKIIKPDERLLKNFYTILKPLNERNLITSNLTNACLRMKDLLLSKLASIEN